MKVLADLFYFWKDYVHEVYQHYISRGSPGFLKKLAQFQTVEK
jgi:hypothetical protein